MHIIIDFAQLRYKGRMLFLLKGVLKEHMALHNLLLDHFLQEEGLKRVLSEGELFVEALSEEVGDTKSIIFLFLKDEVFGEVLEPFPDNFGLCDVVKFKPLLDFIHTFLILISVIVGPPLPELVKVADMQETVFSRVEIHSRSDCLVVVEPSCDLCSVEVDFAVGATASPVDILLESKELGIESLAGSIVVTDGVVGGDCRNWRWFGSHPAVGHLADCQVSSCALLWTHFGTIVIFNQNVLQVDHVAVDLLH
jgi:hypothetical protein